MKRVAWTLATVLILSSCGKESKDNNDKEEPTNLVPVEVEPCAPVLVNSCTIESISNDAAHTRLKALRKCEIISERTLDFYKNADDGTEREKVIFPVLLDTESSELVDIQPVLDSCRLPAASSKVCMIFCNPLGSL
ncbi:hypothetical protein [Pseudobacteriovorax antillogorgiicola]|uniref:Lipoprotein n=1 Tax=Pseudobacteriovorax antillogorgiicola TaxID=1513793 RepID=A0A1Y6CJ17_9BACT|nr:hypothetical protein [Pseudobacteriovorax antillogorgiicola]TCS46429.1 hypothetical protein EDD56_12493 [Pseudobacteriovorax antillogorgiicola]SMF69032.1 hypothetical protein SAMN06296036_12493 [Pseudobacteriovorax antillogorgiicola]